MHFTRFVILLLITTSAAASAFDDIGLTSLRQRSNALLANGAGVTVAQVEAMDAGGFAPNISDTDFAGKRFSFAGISQQPASGHATYIAADIYGNNDGLAPGIKNVLLFSNDSFLGNYALGGGLPVVPAKLGAQVINNSWVGNMTTNAAANDVLRRLDYMIVRDNVFVANAMDNTGAKPVNVLLGAAYNGLNVGVSPGVGTTFTAQGKPPFRLMPDLVVPVSTTSHACAYVAGSAALLISEARAHRKPVSSLGLRASLLAGAERLAGWKSTADSPLDPVQGAGQLRIDHSFDIITGGELAPGGPGRTRGWDSAVANPANTLYYNMTLTRPAPHFSAALIWNRRISDANVPFINRDVTLANLDLQLQLKKGANWVPVSSSFHTGDNIEFIARESLIAGTYRLAVTGNRQETFALAWYTDFTPPSLTQSSAVATALARPVSVSPNSSFAVPEPTLLLLLPLSATLLGRHRRRHPL